MEHKLTTKEEIESLILENYQTDSHLKIVDVLNSIDFKNCNIDEISHNVINYIVYMVVRAITKSASAYRHFSLENGGIFSYSMFRLYIKQLQETVSPAFYFDIPSKLNYVNYVFMVKFKDITRYFEVLNDGNGLKEISSEQEYFSMRPVDDNNTEDVQVLDLKEMEF